MAHGGQRQTSSRKLHRHYLVIAGRKAQVKGSVPVTSSERLGKDR